MPTLRMRALVACAISIVLAVSANRVHAAARDTTLMLAGLGAPVRIVTDRAGVPHLRARTLADLYFAWGFVTARDRLWQLEHQRRGASGTLAQWVGNSALRSDGGAQLFELRERAVAMWERDRADPAIAMALERYCAGINAWLARCRAGEAPWPREFVALGRTPDDWTPPDVALGLYALGLTLDLAVPELDEAEEIAVRGRPAFEARRRFELDYVFDTIPEDGPSLAPRAAGARGPAGGDAPLRHPASGALVLVTRLAGPWLRRGPDAPPAGPRAPAARMEALASARAMLAPWASQDPDSRASNVFAVGAGRSTSGSPLLANDPHLSFTAPGPFHVIHVSVDDTVDAVGASVPGLPFIVSGRSRECAWGLTALGADVVDVYADTLSRDGRSVRTGGGWTRMREAPHRLFFRIPGGLWVPALGQTRRYTSHGPVLSIDRKAGVAYCMRWTALEGAPTLRGLVGLEQARDAAALAERVRRVVTPTINVVVADRVGRVRYQTAGALPMRPFVPVSGPLPSDGAHEWAGIVPADSMPAWDVPRDGFVVNANNRPRGGATAAREWPRFDWAHDRARRISERLAGDRAVTLADLRSVQNDVVSRRAARLVPRLLACADSLADSLGAREREAVAALRGWDFTCRRDRVEPTLYRAWYGAWQRRAGVEGLEGLSAAALDGRAPAWVRGPDAGSPERAAVTVVEALRVALDTLAVALGPDPATWTWGRAHRARFRHALRGVRPGFDDLHVPIDGENGTPCVGASRLPWNRDVVHGPAFRHLVDLAEPRWSWAVVPPGNSGVRGHPHERAMTARWANHGYVALHLNWERIEGAADDAMTLTPPRN